MPSPFGRSAAKAAVAAVLVFPLTAVGQDRHSVPVADSEVVVTVWNPDTTPLAQVLLLPGWGGGPTDVLGIGRELRDDRIRVAVLSPRGWHESGGWSTFANALEDIGVAISWLRTRYESDTPFVLGGHSWGGGMALAYTAQDTSVRRVFSVAGTDHARMIRRYQADPDYRAMVDGILTSTAAPDGPIRFDAEEDMTELVQNQNVYGLMENAAALADRSILLIGGWDDVNVTVDRTLLPLFRALQASEADDVTFLTFHDDHGFGTVRPDLREALAEWIRTHVP